MSEYSTDEIVEWLIGQVSTIAFLSPIVTSKNALENKGMLRVLIARLWAADKLCEAAKGLEWMITIYPHIDLSKISKAIAEYEGKEKL